MALVREFLEWAGLEFTTKVFEPEVGEAGQYHGRMGLSKQLVSGSTRHKQHTHYRHAHGSACTCNAACVDPCAPHAVQGMTVDVASQAPLLLKVLKQYLQAKGGMGECERAAHGQGGPGGPATERAAAPITHWCAPPTTPPAPQSPPARPSPPRQRRPRPRPGLPRPPPAHRVPRRPPPRPA